MIGHEERIEAGAFERLHESLDMPEVEIGVGPRARKSPCACMQADRPHERAEVELSGMWHRVG
jgi:hypothetical protein